jgi:hypothetical protein
MQRRSRNIAVAGSVITVLVVLVLTVPTLAGSSYQFLRHQQCSPSGPTFTTTLWTPIYIIDSPPYGWANATATAPNEPIRWTTVVNGSSVGVFSLDVWAISPQKPAWVWGAGSTTTCNAFVATDLSRSLAGPPSLNVSSITLLPTGATNDSLIPDSINATWNGTAYPSVIFFAALPPANETMTFTACGTGSLEWNTIVQTPLEIVLVPFRTSAGTVGFALNQLAGSESLVYYLPSPGNWVIGWFSVPNPFGTGMSFAWNGNPGSACNSGSS